MKFIIGPLSGDEGLAVKDYAKTKPDVTFVNGTSAAQDTTLRNPATTSSASRPMAPSGSPVSETYVYKEKGYKKVATVAEDYSFPYTQVFGFMAEFCKAGGHVPSKSWVPIGNKDFSSVIAAIPDDVDAIYVALGGADAVNFLTQYQAGWRQGAADRRLDHHRPDGADNEGQDSRGRNRNTVRRSDRRRQQKPGMEGLHRGVQEAAGCVSRHRRSSPTAITSI